MKKTRVLKSWSKRNLPEELWPEVLTRLPVKSLLRFRTVSKSWKSVIDDPSFCGLHLGRFKNNYLETHLFVVQGRHCSQDCVVIKCSKTLRTTKRLCSLNNIVASTNTYTTPLGHVENWDVICSIDGLVMLKNSNRRVTAPELMLWNPSIRKTRSISLPSDIPNGLQCVDMGLGFDPLINDYKHVRLVKQGMDNLHSVVVYTVGTGLWKTVEFQCKACSSWQWYFDFYVYQQAVSFRGCLYLIDMSRNTGVWELISFDLSCEVFSFTSLPEYDPQSTSYQNQVTLFDNGCSLAVCQVSGYNQGSVWVLERSGIDTESTYWTKLYAFPTCFMEGFLFLKKNGDLLIGRCLVMSHSRETGKQERLLKNIRSMDVMKVSRYIESLILLN